MKAKLIYGIFALLTIALFASTALAAPICSGTLCSSLISSPQTVTAGSSVQINFNVTYEGSAQTPPTLTFSTSTTNIGALTLPSSTTINIDQTKTFSMGLNIPSTASGTVDVVINVETSSGSSTSITVPPITISAGSGNSALNLVVNQQPTASQNATVTLTNNGNVRLTNVQLSKTAGNLDVVIPTEIFTLEIGSSRTFALPRSSTGNSGFGESTASIRATGRNPSNVEVFSNTVALSTSGTFCRAGTVGALKLRNVDINNEDGDDNEWQLLDIVEVEVEVENDGNDDVDDVFVEMGLFDSSGDNFVSDLDFEDADEEEIDLGNLNDGDEETVTFRFRVPGDMEDGSYKLVIKAYSDDLGESESCVDSSPDLESGTYEQIDIERENDEGQFIAFEDPVFSLTEATCGDTVSLRTDAYNVGDEDQDQVRFTLFNTELGIRETVEVRNNMDVGDKETLDFNFVIPQNAQSKVYNFELDAEYDYRSGTYRESLDTTDKISLRVIGCGTSGNGNDNGNDQIATISGASLQSDAIAGETLIIRATVTSLQDDSNLVVGVDGYQDWATLEDVSERVLSGLNNGDSRDVTITLNLKSTASSEESFFIEVRSGDLVETREVSVQIETSSEDSGFSFGGNTYLWVIGAVNLVLIILIILVAIRISRR